jgi:chemotaxis protein MotC
MHAVLFSLMLLCAPACAQDAGPLSLSQMLRDWRRQHDHAVSGDIHAGQAAHALSGSLARGFSALEATAATGPEKIAAAAFVLEGGDAGAVKHILTVPAPMQEPLAEGVLAYGERDFGKAAKLLLPISARDQHPVIAAPLALVQAVLAFTASPQSVPHLLREARLLAPGTFVEEAALRRQAFAALESGQTGQREQMVTVYLRRFPQSVHAAPFVLKFAQLSVVSDAMHGEAMFAALAPSVAALGPEREREFYLAIACASVLAGNTSVAVNAAQNALKRLPAGGLGALRAHLYEAAAAVVTSRRDEVAARLRAIDRGRLPQEDAALLDAALAIAEAIASPPSASAATPDSPRQFAAPGVIDVARRSLADADAYLSGARR